MTRSPRLRAPRSPRSPRSPRTVLAAVTVTGVITLALAGCSGDNPYQASEKAAEASTTSVAASDSTNVTGDTESGLEENVFLPEQQDIGDCVGTLERPNCGSSAKGGWRQYLVMLALVLGVAFIAWRVARLVRRRDAIVNADTV